MGNCAPRVTWKHVNGQLRSPTQWASKRWGVKFATSLRQGYGAHKIARSQVRIYNHFHADLEIQFADQTPQYKGWLGIGTELGDGRCVCFTVARQ